MKGGGSSIKTMFYVPVIEDIPLCLNSKSITKYLSYNQNTTVYKY